MNISKFIRNTPFFTITTLSIIGLIIGVCFGGEFSFYMLIALVPSIILSIFFPHIAIYPTIILFGGSLVWLHETNTPQTYIEQNSRVVVVNQLSRLDYKAKLIEFGENIYDNNIVIIKPLGRKLILKSGDTITTKLNLSPIAGSSLRNKNIYLADGIDYFAKLYPDTLIIKRGKKIIESDTYLSKSADLIDSRLDSINTNPQIVAQLKAMISGNKEELDYETTQKYRLTGVSHYLAISGWHIAIIFMFLNIILYFMNWIKYGIYIKSIIIVSFIWAYAAMVGFSPSVTRAALMFTMFQYTLFYNISRALKYNIIFGSIFLFMCYDYNTLFSVGFQLSYIAVLSIHIFYNRITHALKSKFWILNWLLKAISLYISVQILIIPILLYYFGFYTLSGIITNIIFAIFMPTILICSIIYTLVPLELLSWIVDKLFIPIESTLNQFSEMEIFWLTKSYISEIDIVIYYLGLLIVMMILEPNKIKAEKLEIIEKDDVYL